MGKILVVLLSIAMCFLAIANASEKIVLDGKSLKNREEIFAVFNKEISFPKNASLNFDLLSEVLTSEIDSPKLIQVKNLNLMKIRFGKKFSNDLLEAVMLASDVNKKIILVVE